MARGEKSFKIVGHVALVDDDVAAEIQAEGASGFQPFTGQVKYPGDKAFAEDAKQ